MNLILECFTLKHMELIVILLFFQQGAQHFVSQELNFVFFAVCVFF